MHYVRPLSLLLAATLLTISAIGCEKHRKAPPLSDAEIEELVAGQPQIFVDKQSSMTLEGIENLYLGQSYDEAMEALHGYCGDGITVYDGGWRHSDAVFKGCLIDEGTTTRTIRAGFWPFNDDRVSTLEIKSQVIALPVVRARFSQLSQELSLDLPRRGLLQMANNRYRLIANWDEGLDKPVHITIGFHPP